MTDYFIIEKAGHYVNKTEGKGDLESKKWGVALSSF